MTIHVQEIDSETRLILLSLPPSQVVLLQSMVELYEGIGTVRTFNVKDCLIGILTTPDMAIICEQLLVDLRHSIQWRSVMEPLAADALQLVE